MYIEEGQIDSDVFFPPASASQPETHHGAKAGWKKKKGMNIIEAKVSASEIVTREN